MLLLLRVDIPKRINMIKIISHNYDQKIPSTIFCHRCAWRLVSYVILNF